MFLAINLIIILFLMVPLNAYAVDSSSDSHIHFVSQDLSSPKSQFENGITIDKIVCQTGLELVMKKSDGTPACIKPVSVSRLVERGWALHVLPDYSKDNTNSEAFARGDLSVITDEVNYFENYTGFVARPDNTENYPGIVMIHEWWGLNDNIRDMAKELASHGYVVLAVDLYGQPAATTADEARQLVSSYDLQQGVSNMNAAVDYLVNNYNAKKIGSIGWCFGGGQSLNLAIDNDHIDATVIYYGSLTSDKAKLSHIKWPVLGIFAGLDQGIPVESVHEFESSLNELNIKNEIHIYPNVNHAFANPSGANYAPEETQDAWKKTLSFFDQNL